MVLKSNLHAGILPQDRVALIQLVGRRDRSFYRHRRLGLLFGVVLRECYGLGGLVDDAGDVAAHIGRKGVVVEPNNLDRELAGVLDELLENLRAIVLPFKPGDGVVLGVVEDAADGRCPSCCGVRYEC